MVRSFFPAGQKKEQGKKSAVPNLGNISDGPRQQTEPREGPKLRLLGHSVTAVPVTEFCTCFTICTLRFTPVKKVLQVHNNRSKAKKGLKLKTIHPRVFSLEIISEGE